MRTEPRPTLEAMRRYYPDEYGPHQVVSVSPSSTTNRPRWRRALGSLMWRLADSKAESLPRMTPGRLLEVGCGSGSFLSRMALEGWDVEGIEVSETAAARARALGHTVHVGNLADIAISGKRFDVVAGWMVLEHLHDPLAALRRLRSWIRPGGWLVLSLPDAGALGFKLLRGAWYDLDLPRHLYHFDRRTLRDLLEKCGWRVTRFVTQRSILSLVASAGYLLDDLGLAAGVAGRLKSAPDRPGRLPLLLFPAAFALSLVGQTGRVVVWAHQSRD